jgi:hypothetical protein
VSCHPPSSVIPAKAGIHLSVAAVDPRLRGDDGRGGRRDDGGSRSGNDEKMEKRRGEKRGQSGGWTCHGQGAG